MQCLAVRLWQHNFGSTGMLAAMACTRCTISRAQASVVGNGAQVEVLADKNGGLMRLLGVEIGAPDSTTEPRCNRFAAIVEDGILLKLVSTLVVGAQGDRRSVSASGWGIFAPGGAIAALAHEAL